MVVFFPYNHTCDNHLVISQSTCQGFFLRGRLALSILCEQPDRMSAFVDVSVTRRLLTRCCGGSESGSVASVSARILVQVPL